MRRRDRESDSERKKRVEEGLIRRNDEFIVDERGPSRMNNKEVQMELDDIGTILLRRENHMKLKYYMITKNADREGSIEASWRALKSDLDGLERIGLSENVGVVIWGVECHRAGRNKTSKYPRIRGRPHIHGILGVGTNSGEPWKDREVRYVLRKAFQGEGVDIKVNELKNYKDMCNSLGYILKEYGKEDVRNNLKIIEENRRYKVISTSGMGLLCHINNINKILKKFDVYMNIIEKGKVNVLPFTKDEGMRLAYRVVKYLKSKNMLIDRAGGVFEKEENRSKVYKKKVDLRDLTIGVAKTEGIMEPFMKGEGIERIMGFIKDYMMEGIEVEKGNQYIELEDTILDVLKGRLLDKDTDEISSCKYSIDRRLGDIDFPKEFDEYIGKAISPKNKEIYMNFLLELILGKKLMQKVLYISGKSGTGKSMIFRELIGKYHKEKQMILTPLDMKNQFVFEGVKDSKVIVYDEFHKESMDSGRRSKTLLLLEGGEMTVNEKYKKQRKIRIDMPKVIISNLSLDSLTVGMDKDKVEPLRRRVVEIKIKETDIRIEEIYENIVNREVEVLLYLGNKVVGIRNGKGELMKEGEIFRK